MQRRIKNRIFLVGIIVVLFSGNSIAQRNTLLLVNGKVLDGKVKHNDGEFIKFEYQKKDNLFIKEIDVLRVYSFSINDQETIVYKKDTAVGNVFSQDEMRMYIYGESDSEKSIKSWPYFVSGAAFSFGMSVFDTYSTRENDKGFFKADPSMLHFAVPFVVPIVCGKIKPKIKAKHVSDDLFLVNEQYIMGYQKDARYKRIMGGLFGSLTGTFFGILTYSLSK
ncbi:hypothetical protein OAW23_03120 [Flavobacteriales bacterium]|nr:hypothetical protein [Flavobacteriales bacterium]